MYRIATLVTGFFLTASIAFTQEATFEGLGELPGGIFLSHARAVSADGATVVGLGGSENGVEAFRWEGGTIQGLGDLPGGSLFFSIANAVSADGSMIVGESSSANSGDGTEAFRWENGDMQGLGSLSDEGEISSSAQGVSADGTVVVGSSHSEDQFQEAFRWENGQMKGLGNLTGDSLASAATAVSGDGTVVVGGVITELERFRQEAFRWENGEMQRLAMLPGNGSISVANDISADGSVIVGQSDSEIDAEAFRWEDGEIEGLGVLGDAPLSPSQVLSLSSERSVVTGRKATDENSNREMLTSLSQAFACSEDGSVVVGWSTTEEDPFVEAFIWTQDAGMKSLKQVLENDYDLDLTGWTLGAAWDVSDDGTVIVGIGNNPEGNPEAFRAVIPHTIADEATPEALTEVLSAPSPNPASGTSTFTIAVERGQHVAVEVFDVMGRQVQTVYEGALAAGMSETLTLNASALPAGVYLILATGEDFTKTQRVTIVN